MHRHLAAAIAALADLLDSPDPRVKLRAALALLRYAEAPPAGDGAGRSGGPFSRLSDAELEQAIALLRRHLEPDESATAKPANRAATSCPARHAAGAPQPPPPSAGADAATDSLETDAAPKNTPLAEPELTPCPAGAAPTAASPTSPNPSANSMSRENRPSPLAAPTGTDSPRRDADPMSRAVVPKYNRATDPFYRRLPTSPPMEPPGFYDPVHDRRRRPPWR